MGEEAKKAEEEKKAEEAKPKVEEDKPKPPPEEEKPKAEGGGEEKKKKDGEEAAAAAPAPPPPPPEEIEMRVFMHCDGCARKVKRSLKGFEGVEEVSTDCKTHKVVVKGKKAAEDPMKVVERVQRKTGRKVELLTPLPPPKEEKKEEEKKEEEKPKVEEKKEEPPVIAVVLKVHMHCEACSQEIKKRILKMKGVQSAEPDLKASQVTVKGVIDPAKLVEYVYKRTGKHAAVVKSEPVEKKPEEEKPKEEAKDGDKKAEGGKEGEKGEEKKEKEGGDAAAAAGAPAAEGGGEGEKKEKVVELKKDDFFYYYPPNMRVMEMPYPPHFVAYPTHVAYPPPPQMFSDENPNACSVM